MSTIDKALELLDLFTEARAVLRLSEAARLTGRDKASLLRYFAALERRGFVERDSESRGWRLGPALVRLAALRETTWPVQSAARGILMALADETGETAHLSHFAARQLINLAIVESDAHPTRVRLGLSEALPLHATASGIAVLSSLPEAARRATLGAKRGGLARYTATTLTDPGEVLAQAARAQVQGYAVVRGTFEADVTGVAAPVFGRGGEVCGAIAVAAPSARAGTAEVARIGQAVMSAAVRVSHQFGAPIPPLRRDG
ncbi:MAG: IclR family transcriptional regulator [Rhodobacteraceae bacterium]|nr:IclR family transcriptional regulator [Paracoccaceae bacterium]